MSRRDDSIAAITTGVTVTVAGLAVGFGIVAVHLGVGFAIPVGIVGLVCAGVVLRGPLGQALVRRLERGAEHPADQEAMLAALDEMRARMLELEERVDFAERMLARSREPDRLQS